MQANIKLHFLVSVQCLVLQIIYFIFFKSDKGLYNSSLKKLAEDVQETTIKTTDILSCFQHLVLEKRNYLTVFSSSLLLKTVKWQEINYLRTSKGFEKVTVKRQHNYAGVLRGLTNNILLDELLGKTLNTNIHTMAAHGLPHHSWIK